MAANAVPAGPTPGSSATADRQEPGPLWSWLAPVSSLLLTIVLFALAIVLILIGTLAQDKHGHVGRDVPVLPRPGRDGRGRRVVSPGLVSRHQRAVPCA